MVQIQLDNLKLLLDADVHHQSIIDHKENYLTDI